MICFFRSVIRRQAAAQGAQGRLRFFNRRHDIMAPFGLYSGGRQELLRIFQLWALQLTAALLVSASTQDSVRAALDQYCVVCHNQRLKTAALELDKADLAQVPQRAELWEKVVLKLRTGTMPPAGARRPDAATYDAVASWIETQIDGAARAHPWAGRPLLHRLNRSEYGNAIRDLLDLEIEPSALLPPDDSAFGFDNISSALGVSPSLQERYLSAASKIAALAVGDPHSPPSSQTWRIRQDLSQNQHLDGLPLGTVGGVAVRYNFPLDGRYRFQAKLYRTNLNIVRGLETAQQVEFSVDGKRIHLASIGGPEDLASLFEKPTETGDAVDARLNVEVPISAGPHAIAAAFLDNAPFAEPARLQPFLRSSVDNFDWAGHPHLQTLTVTGPFQPTGSGDTPSRRRIFVCHSSSPSTETPCARKIIAELVRRAYRELAGTTDLQRVMKFYEAARTEGGFERGIQAALERVLASPKFVFRPERDPTDVAPGSSYPIGGFEIASRLSFFLWSSIPDYRSLELAAQGKLSQPDEQDREVRRMLADPRSEALVSNFAAQWLELRNLTNFQPNTNDFPDFDDNLRQSFRRETELLFQSVLMEDRSVLDLLNADYTFVNERLARHYGIPNVYGSGFRRVAIHDDARKGLLGQGSILALTSHAERTSPVLRGKWILENMLGLYVAPPPADVPPLKEQKEGEKPRTMREQMEEHRANPVCASCHKTLDPIGFSLENFDAVGAWRAEDAGEPIDASGVLADGTHVNGVVSLRQALMSRPEVFVTALTEKLLTYALGRGLDYRDMPQVRAIVRGASRDNYRFSALILGVVHSAPFQMRTAGTPGTGVSTL
jgi:mono/diheme cytochrome c family protein